MDIFEEWLFKAEEDIRLSELAFKIDPSIGIAIFHTQQCAEKSLKAFLAYKNKPLEKTHNLLKLLELCSEVNKQFLSLQEDLEILNPFSTEFRYPGMELSPRYEDMGDAIQRARKVLSFVKMIINL